MSSIFSFPPVSATNSLLLILGSIPGGASLAKSQYYAHPRNAFWPVVGKIMGFNPAAPYDIRCNHLLQSGVALWDVLHTCERSGSLDSSIIKASMRPNDFNLFFQNHPQITSICFNGATAEKIFKKLVLKNLPQSVPLPTMDCLPSTSPAHASLTVQQKYLQWHAQIGTLSQAQ